MEEKEGQIVAPLRDNPVSLKPDLNPQSNVMPYHKNTKRLLHESLFLFDY